MKIDRFRKISHVKIPTCKSDPPPPLSLKSCLIRFGCFPTKDMETRIFLHMKDAECA